MFIQFNTLSDNAVSYDVLRLHSQEKQCKYIRNITSSLHLLAIILFYLFEELKSMERQFITTLFDIKTSLVLTDYHHRKSIINI